jgi:hypothetical protein
VITPSVAAAMTVPLSHGVSDVPTTSNWSTPVVLVVFPMARRVHVPPTLR